MVPRTIAQLAVPLARVFLLSVCWGVFVPGLLAEECSTDDIRQAVRNSCGKRVVDLLEVEKSEFEIAGALTHALNMERPEIAAEIARNFMLSIAEDLRERLICYSTTRDSIRLINVIIEKLGWEAFYSQARCLALKNAAEFHSLEGLILIAGDGRNVRERDRWGRTPLFYAAASGQLENVVELVKMGSSPNVVDNFGHSPIHMSAGKPDVLSALVVAGARIDARSRGGKTALMIAAQAGNGEAVRLLLSLGASPGDTDAEGLTAAEHARKNGYHELARILGDRGLLGTRDR